MPRAWVTGQSASQEGVGGGGGGVVARALLTAGSVYELSAGMFFFLANMARYIKQLDYENVIVDEGAARVTYHA